MKNIIGITGRIGSGKSFAGRFFKKLGADFIDCDDVVAKLYDKEGLGARKIEEFFGDEFIKDGKVNRTKLGKFVAKDEKKLRILEKIIHPIVMSELQKELDNSARKRSDPRAQKRAPKGATKRNDLVFIEIGAPSEKFLSICKKIICIEASKTKPQKKYLAEIDKFKVLPKADITIKNTFNKKTFESSLLKTYNTLV